MGDRQCQAKLVLLGESAVGKSSIVKQFVQGQFSECQEATIGAAFLTHTVICGNPPKSVRFEIWDTAGQERYRSLAPMYYRGAQAAVIVYDITSSASFKHGKSWYDELKKNASSLTVIALAGNKVDLQDERAVLYEEAKAYADEHGLIFLETSAKYNTNLVDLFTLIAERCLTTPSDAPPRGLLLNPGDTNNKAGQCCR